jgi:monoamine oxidase
MSVPFRGRLSRRGFLAGASAAFVPLVAGPLEASPLVAPRAGSARIAIVGAGIAGLTAARVLRDRGIASTVYEAQHRIGGRMHSEPHFWGNGQVSEYGGELIDSDHTAIQALVKRFDLRLADELADEGDREQAIFLGGHYYPERQLFEDFRPVYRTLTRQIAAAGFPTTYARSNSAGRELDTMSLSQWIRTYVPGGLSSDLGRYLELQYTAEYGIEPDVQSSLNMVYWLGRQPQYDERTGEFVTLGPSDERYHIIGGNDRLPHAIAASLPEGTVRLGERLEAIARRPDGTIALTFANADGTRTETFDKAIITVPFIVLRDIDTSRADFDSRKKIAIAKLAYGDHSKLILQFDRRYWRERGPWPGIGSGDLTYDGPFVQTWEATRGQPGPTGMLVDFAAASGSAKLHPRVPYSTSASPDTAAYAHAFAEQLDRPLPGARKHFTGKATLSHLRSDPFARGSYSGWSRGQYTLFAGYERVRQGNVLFAGEHCSVLLQGFMEGAAREGARAARDVLHDLGATAALS